MGVMAKRQHVACRGVGCRLRDVVAEVILRVLDQIWTIIQVVERVEVIVDDVVANGLQASKAVAIAVDVRRAEVCWKKAQNITEGHFVVVDLVVEISLTKTNKVLMRPCMAGYLMA